RPKMGGSHPGSVERSPASIHPGHRRSDSGSLGRQTQSPFIPNADFRQQQHQQPQLSHIVSAPSREYQRPPMPPPRPASQPSSGGSLSSVLNREGPEEPPRQQQHARNEHYPQQRMDLDREMERQRPEFIKKEYQDRMER